MLHEHNEQVRIFKTALEQRTPDMPDYRVVIRADRVPRGQHQRKFNAPSGNDVAALLPEGQEGYRDIVLPNRDTVKSLLKAAAEVNSSRTFSAATIQERLLFAGGLYVRQSPERTQESLHVWLYYVFAYLNKKQRVTTGRPL